jgi:hypothetical protein
MGGPGMRPARQPWCRFSGQATSPWHTRKTARAKDRRAGTPPHAPRRPRPAPHLWHILGEGDPLQKMQKIHGAGGNTSGSWLRLVELETPSKQLDA